MMAGAQAVVPVEIGRANAHDVKIRWQDGHESVYPARELRMSCPCAGCVDPSTRTTAPGRGLAQDSAPQSSAGLREVTGHVRVIASSIAQTVHPVKIDLIGRYAISITWSDGHNTGIYSFERLRQLCPCGKCRVTSVE